MPEPLTTILAVAGVLLASLSLLIQWRTFRSDRPSLQVEARLKRWHTTEVKELHNNLTIVLTNHGQRIIRIRAVDLIVFPESITIAATTYSVSDFRFNLFDATTKGLMQIAERDRREIIAEPYEMLPKEGNPEAIVEVTDALNTRYRVRLLYS